MNTPVRKGPSMMRISTITASLLGLAGSMTPLCLAQESKGKGYPAPGYEGAILEFERVDRTQPPPTGAIVVTGSSHIRKWKTIEEDFAPLTVIHRGYGGSTYRDALRYAERIVIPYKPRAVVVYSGNNDLHHGVAPETIRDTCRAFVEKVRSQLPEVRIYVVSIPPAILGWEGRDAGMWPIRMKTNRLLREYCAEAGLTWIDVATPMFGADGRPRKELFGTDNLHLTREGYLVWRDAVMPVLMKKEFLSAKK